MSVDQIDALEGDLRQAMMTNNVPSLDRLIAAELTFVGPDGRIAGKEADLEAHRQRRLKLSRLDLADPVIQDLGTVVIVTVRAEMAGTFDGVPFAGPYMYTRVWNRQAGKDWQIVAGHVSAAGP